MRLPGLGPAATFDAALAGFVIRDTRPTQT
jgi:hypothetical protein